MKHLYILSAVALLSLACCSKQQEITRIPKEDLSGGINEFTAVIDASKVSFNAGKLAWKMEDEVMISDGTTKSLFSVSKIENGIATFSLVDGQQELLSSGVKYTAVYPAEAFDALQQISIESAGQETSCLPMGAVSTNAKLVFTNLCALVQFSLSTNTENAAVKSVRITADKPLSGAYEIVDGAAVMTGSAPVSAQTSCSLDAGFPLGSSPLVLFAVVPAGEYSRFDIEVVTSTGVKKAFPLVTGPISLARSKIYTKNITLNDLDINDFREEGPANCYIATHKGKYRFAAEYNDGTSVEGVSGVRLIWTYNNTQAGPEPGTIITALSYKDGVIDFQTDGEKGSALIAGVDKSGKILWSWNIWCTDGMPEDITYPDGVLMDRYLGALSAIPGDIKCVGYMFQYGRKDPFPGRVLAGNTVGCFCGDQYSEEAGPVDIQTAVSHPTVRYYGTDSNFWTTAEARADATWDGNSKTLQDPCPYGYRVPANNILGTTAKADIQKMFAWDATNFGLSFMNGLAWYPATGQFAPKGKNLNSGTAISFSWARNANSNGNPFLLDLRSSAINGWGGGAAAAGFAVRCEKSSK